MTAAVRLIGMAESLARSRVPLRLVLGLAILLAAGCARENPGTRPVPAFGPDDLVLQVAHYGGFRGMIRSADVPAISVYGDGRVITQGPQIEIYPPPALPNLQVATISQADLARLVDRASQARVGEKLDFGQPGIADAMSTKFRVRTSEGLQTTDVYALRESESVDNLTAEQKANRQRLVDLLDAVQDLDKTLGDGAVGPQKPYQATAVAGLTREWTADPNGPQPEKAWPGPALPGSPLPDSGFGCVSATGDQAKGVLAAAEKANAATPWTSDGKKWFVQIRPLLPDEVDCGSLAV